MYSTVSKKSEASPIVSDFLQFVSTAVHVILSSFLSLSIYWHAHGRRGCQERERKKRERDQTEQIKTVVHRKFGTTRLASRVQNF